MVSPERPRRDQVFHLLRSPVRRGIIRLLGDRVEVSFTDLKKAFANISVGTLYYHLDALDQIVAQNPAKHYVLTEEGQRIFAEILRSEETMIPVKASFTPESKSPSNPVSFVSRLFSEISLRPQRYLVAPFVVFLLTDFFALLSHSIQVLFFFITVNGASAAIVAVSAAASLIAIYIPLNLLTITIFRRREGNLALLAATSVGLSPLLLYPLVIYAVSAGGGQASIAFDPFNISLRIISQALSLLLLSEGLSQAKGLALYKSALLTLSIIYANILLLYFLGFVQV